MTCCCGTVSEMPIPSLFLLWLKLQIRSKLHSVMLQYFNCYYYYCCQHYVWACSTIAPATTATASMFRHELLPLLQLALCSSMHCCCYNYCQYVQPCTSAPTATATSQYNYYQYCQYVWICTPTTPTAATTASIFGHALQLLLLLVLLLVLLVCLHMHSYYYC